MNSSRDQKEKIDLTSIYLLKNLLDFLIIELGIVIPRVRIA